MLVVGKRKDARFQIMRLFLRHKDFISGKIIHCYIGHECTNNLILWVYVKKIIRAFMAKINAGLCMYP
ncbi:hypothetical protein EG344_04295 [Chryseobacterium sp. G0162]|nr:hypothetical protein EG344_04295 [Chryseobacterium sp. G0162]